MTVRKSVAFATLFVLFALAPEPAHAAYIDPVSGSIIIQAVIAGFLAVAFNARRAWGKVTTKIRGTWPRKAR